MENSVREILYGKWKLLCRKYTTNVVLVEKWFKKLEVHYNSPKRFYHNFEHIHQFMNCCDRYEGEIEDLECFQFAIFFHDLIYDSSRKDNEKKSSECFREFGKEIKQEEKMIKRVEELIDATAKHLSSGKKNRDDSDMLYFLDFDLMILAEDLDVYRKYCLNVRKEYGNFSKEEWIKGRTNFINGFVKEEEIYFQVEKKEEFFKKAIENLNWEKNEFLKNELKI